MRNRVGSVGYALNLCDMVTLLLEHGAESHSKFDEITPFQYLFPNGISRTYDEHSLAAELVDIARTLIQRGQDPGLPITYWARGTIITIAFGTRCNDKASSCPER
jgi:hypothetical protein